MVVCVFGCVCVWLWLCLCMHRVHRVHRVKMVGRESYENRGFIFKRGLEWNKTILCRFFVLFSSIWTYDSNKFSTIFPDWNSRVEQSITQFVENKSVQYQFRQRDIAHHVISSYYNTQTLMVSSRILANCLALLVNISWTSSSTSFFVCVVYPSNYP